MDELTTAEQNLVALRSRVDSALLATLGENRSPEASYAPCVWYQENCYLFLSELARHTRNLTQNSQISLMLIEDASASSNPFARPRLSLYGTVEEVAAASDRFAVVMPVFHQRFGKVMQVIAALPDFHLFCVKAEAGSFIQGFGQAYDLVGDKLDRLRPIDPRN